MVLYKVTTVDGKESTLSSRLLKESLHWRNLMNLVHSFLIASYIFSLLFVSTQGFDSFHLPLFKIFPQRLSSIRFLRRSLFGSRSFATPIMTDKSPEPIVLRREDFNTTIPLIALTVPTKLCSQYLDKFGKYLLNRPRVKRIYDAIPPSSGVKLLLLGEKIKSLTPSENGEESLPADLVQFHENHCQEHQVPAPYYVTYPFQLTYDHYSADEVLSRYLSPITTEIPSSFETIGHIAHMNLRDDIVGYKHLIGQVILDKNPILKIVVNKIGNIETKFRTFPLEIIAKREDKEEEESTAGGKGKKGGKASTSKKGNAPIDEDEENNDFVVQIKESNAIFHFNFAEVYWNSRLQYEHQRIIDIIRQTATETSPRIVADMMAGVGPFAVPLAMTIINQTTPASTDKNRKNKKISPVTVYANDLNPVSYKYLVKNRDVNRCNHTLHPFNLDGRDFMLQLVQQQKIYPHEVVMNLPAIATEFLDVFIGLYAQSPNPSPMPRIHVYAFSTDESNPINDILHRAAGVLQCAPELLSAGPDYAGHVVRDVAPKKVMVCLSFTLPVEVATRQVSKDVMEISEDNVEEHQKVARKRTREEGENNDEENDRSMEKKER